VQLVSALEDDLDLSDYRDEYRDRVLELVEAKAEGRVLKFPQATKKESEASLAKMLEKSVQDVKRRRASG
jgi:DNA end-binding protein Ku